MTLKCRTSFIQWLKTNILFVLLLFGVIFGFLGGFFLNKTVQNSINPTPNELAMFISFPGELFLENAATLGITFRCLKCYHLIGRIGQKIRN
jgi:hypothetical protein